VDRTYRLVVEYDGTQFSGFQFQPHERTIAGDLEAGLSRLFDQPVKLTAAGRTDAGVHAVGQVVSFAAHDRFPIEKLALALNAGLPPDLSVRDAAVVAEGFSARRAALERSYTYVVFNRREPSAPARRWSAFEHRTLDLAVMRRAAASLVGSHDFLSFCGVFPERGRTVRTLHALEIEEVLPFVRLHFRADGFLHRMVRIMTGTLLEIASGRRPADAIPGILGALDRKAAGLTAPPQGLYLVAVRYADFSSRPAGKAAFGI
jgi:tRNA pseudouridine38-40 synthase